MVDVKSELQELEALQQQVNNRRKALRSDAVREAQQIIDQFELVSSDFRFADIEAARKAKRAPVLPKYKGPNGELWTGRGRTPKWAERVMEAGEDIREYLINKPSAE
ncbi:MAG: H-NS histone family protein [Sutterella sp.]|nr:H-NS histone family protein [Sutterella sp.]